jgi:hypothetical protein
MSSLEAIAKMGYYGGTTASMAKVILHAEIPTLQSLIEKRGASAIMGFVCNLGAFGNPHNSAFRKLDDYEAVSEEAMTGIVESLEEVARTAAWYRGRQTRALLARTSRPRLVETPFKA